jgi:hypothetical protein
MSTMAMPAPLPTMAVALSGEGGEREVAADVEFAATHGAVAVDDGGVGQELEVVRGLGG